MLMIRRIYRDVWAVVGRLLCLVDAYCVMYGRIVGTHVFQLIALRAALCCLTRLQLKLCCSDPLHLEFMFSRFQRYLERAILSSIC